MTISTEGPNERDEAVPGSLLPESALALRLLQGFLRNRDEALADLIGPTYRQDPLRDELLRLVVLDFSEGRRRGLSAYQTELHRYGSKSSVKRALDSSVLDGLLIVSQDPDDGRAIVAYPTVKLIEFYNRTMLDVIEGARKAFDLLFGSK